MSSEVPVHDNQDNVADAYKIYEDHAHEPKTIIHLSRDLRRAKSQERRAVALGIPILLLTFIAILTVSAARYFPSDGEPSHGLATRLLVLVGLPESASLGWGFILLCTLIGI